MSHNYIEIPSATECHCCGDVVETGRTMLWLGIMRNGAYQGTAFICLCCAPSVLAQQEQEGTR
jgi:hypothetical protein